MTQSYRAVVAEKPSLIRRSKCAAAVPCISSFLAVEKVRNAIPALAPTLVAGLLSVLGGSQPMYLFGPVIRRSALSGSIETRKTSVNRIRPSPTPMELRRSRYAPSPQARLHFWPATLQRPWSAIRDVCKRSSEAFFMSRGPTICQLSTLVGAYAKQ